MSSEDVANQIFEEAVERILAFRMPRERAAAWASLREKIEVVEELEQETRRL